MVDNLRGAASDAATDLLDRAEELLDEDATAEQARGRLDGAVGTLLAVASMAFGRAWGRMTRSASEAGGAEEYEWSSLHDGKVRPEHERLDGARSTWDEPPLTADQSDNEEDCHPGDDYGCRCLAVPVAPEEASDDDSGDDED